jgi:hypothetical protein
MTTINAANQQNASLVAEAISMEGEAEQKMQKALKKKRAHIQTMSRLDAMGKLADNNKVVIFGEQGTNLMS